MASRSPIRIVLCVAAPLCVAALLGAAAGGGCATSAAPDDRAAEAIRRETRAAFGSADPGPLVWIPDDGPDAHARRAPRELVAGHADAIESLLAAHDGRAGHFTLAGASDDLAAQALWVALYRSRGRDLSRLTVLLVGAPRDEAPLRRLAAQMGVQLLVRAP